MFASDEDFERWNNSLEKEVQKALTSCHETATYQQDRRVTFRLKKGNSYRLLSVDKTLSLTHLELFLQNSLGLDRLLDKGIANPV